MTNKVNEPRFGTVITLIAFVVLCWAGLGLFASYREKPGEFGDMFGAVNALFSGLAFAGVIYAIWLQRLELRLQRRELEATREVLTGQREQLEEQNRTLRKQNFEDTFFQLLRRFGELVGEISYDRASGRAALFKLYDERLRFHYEEAPVNLARPERTEMAYKGFYNEWHHQLGHYFRMLYHIFRFVEVSPLTYAEKTGYANIARAQLSTYELCLLFYNGVTGEGAEGFKPLIEKYGILKHVDPNALLNYQDWGDESYYRPPAFMAQADREQWFRAHSHKDFV